MHDVLWGKGKPAEEGGEGGVLKMFLRNGSQKCFSERANGFAAAPVTATATHKKGSSGSS